MIHVGINGSPYMMLSQNQMVQQQYQIQLQQQMLAQSAYQEVRYAQNKAQKIRPKIWVTN